MTIRPELPGDRDNALDVERLAFQQARNSDAVDDIVEAIRAVRDEQGSFALVAEHDGVIVRGFSPIHARPIKAYTTPTTPLTASSSATMKDSRRSCRGDRRFQSERVALHDLRRLDRRPAIIARCTSVSERTRRTERRSLRPSPASGAAMPQAHGCAPKARGKASRPRPVSSRSPRMPRA
jgi:hypothetical protein